MIKLDNLTIKYNDVDSIKNVKDLNI